MANGEGHAEPSSVSFNQELDRNLSCKKQFLGAKQESLCHDQDTAVGVRARKSLGQKRCQNIYLRKASGCSFACDSDHFQRGRPLGVVSVEEAVRYNSGDGRNPANVRLKGSPEVTKYSPWPPLSLYLQPF